MVLDDFFRHIVSFTGSVNPGLIIALFTIAAIGEFGFSIPYLLETLWLLSAYHVGSGLLPFPYLVLLWLSAEAGRQAGSLSFYYLSRLGATPFLKLYEKYFKENLEKQGNGILPSKLMRQINYLSPFSVAIGRLVWLRIPLTITLSLKKRLGTLLLAVLISSLVWDATYILLGLIGGKTVLTPLSMVLYSLAGLTVLYLLTFAVRHLPKRMLSWR